MKTLGDFLKDYIGGLFIWAMIITTICAIAYESQYILQNDTFLYAILNGLASIAFFILTPLGITQIAKTLKETKHTDQITGIEYVPKRFQ